MGVGSIMIRCLNCGKISEGEYENGGYYRCVCGFLWFNGNQFLYDLGFNSEDTIIDWIKVPMGSLVVMGDIWA